MFAAAPFELPQQLHLVQFAVAVGIGATIQPGSVTAVDDDVEAIEGPEEALRAAKDTFCSVRPFVVELDRLNFWQAGSLPHGGHCNPEEAGVGLIGDDQAAVWIEAHADPGAFVSRHAVKQLDLKIFGDFDLVDWGGLGRAAVVSRWLGPAFPFANLAKRGRKKNCENQQRGSKTKHEVHGESERLMMGRVDRVR
jgi:hypothetical protein